MIIGAAVVLVVAVLAFVGAFTDDGGGGLKLSYNDFYYAAGFNAGEDEGTVYGFDGKGLKIFQSTSEGVLVKGRNDNLVWVVPENRYADGASLKEGFYIRRGMFEYESRLGVRTVPCYYEVTGNLLKKVQKQIEDNKAAVVSAAAGIAALPAGTSAGETKSIPLPGGVELVLVWCPAGSFTMGRDGDFDNEWPPHEVTLTKGFWLAQTEVTQAQWGAVMGNNPSRHKGDDLPVENVSWNDCQEFCQKLGMSLPTEAQWEYACRAGSTGDFAGTGNLDDMGWYWSNSGGKSHPVKQKRPNAWGLYDMHGNVQEWCRDWYGDYPQEAVTDPQGAVSGSYRVRRGGSWHDNGEFYCRSSFRHDYYNSERDEEWGFRPVRVLPAE